LGRTSSDHVAASGAGDKALRRIPVRRPGDSAAARVGRLIWPQRSLVSGDEVAGPGLIEPEYWSKLQFPSEPLCGRCGAPFEIMVDPGQRCGACLARPPAYDRARSALIYGDISRDFVLALKYQGRRDGLDLMGGWMALAGAELLQEAELIVPVPLHYLRLIQRGFNQSVWLAAAVRRRTGVQVCVDALKRVKPTPSQGGLSADGRRRNVQGAFRVRKAREKLIRNRRILIIDDVLTTGATTEACARVLKRAGASCVDVLTLARVAGPSAVPI
jgi:ComF family protein